MTFSVSWDLSVEVEYAYTVSSENMETTYFVSQSNHQIQRLAMLGIAASAVTSLGAIPVANPIVIP